MLDGGFDLDIEAATENIAEAEIVTLYFPMLRKTLLVDTRCTNHVQPYIGVVPMARSSAERFESLKRLRPQLPRPDSITMIPWARRIAAIEEAGIWQQLITRLVDTGLTDCVERAAGCLQELYALEHQEMANAIRGHQYETVWHNRELGPA